MEILERIKAILRKYYYNKLPRFVRLGQIRDRLYFLDCHTGILHEIAQDYRTDGIVIKTVLHF